IPSARDTIAMIVTKGVLKSVRRAYFRLLIVGLDEFCGPGVYSAADWRLQSELAIGDRIGDWRLNWRLRRNWRLAMELAIGGAPSAHGARDSWDRVREVRCVENGEAARGFGDRTQAVEHGGLIACPERGIPTNLDGRRSGQAAWI